MNGGVIDVTHHGEAAAGQEVRMEHLFDEDKFAGGLGLLVEHEMRAKGFIAVEILVEEKNVLRIHAVLESVFRTNGLAFRRDRPSGLERVKNAMFF